MSAYEQMYRRVLECVPDGIWVVSPQGETIFCNERMAQILGTDAESLQRMSCFDPVFPDDLEDAQRQFGRQMAGTGQPFDFRLRRVDGTPIWVSISCKPMYNDGGDCIGLLGLFTDITKRRQAEKDLQDSETRFRAIFFQAAVGIAQTALDGQWLLLNNRFCEILGYPPDELRGKTFVDITHPDDRQDSLAAVRQLLSGEISSWSIEKRYIRKDGATVWGRVFTSLVRDQRGQPQYFVTAVEDITGKIQAERALRDTEQRLTLAQNAANLGVWDRDLKTDVITTCGKYAPLHGLPPDRTTLTGEEWFRLIHPDDRERVQSLMREAREQTHTFDGEFRVVWPDGSVHWLWAKGTVLPDDSGRPVRTMGVVGDITERKRADAALRESEERFRNMADGAPVMIWVSGLDKLCTFFNKPWLDFTGRTMEQEVGHGWAQGVHPADLNRCLDTYNSSFHARRAFQMEYRLRRADGTYRWVLDNGVPLYRGSEFAGFIGSCVDITDQKLIEERLRASEEQLKDAQRLTKVGSWERDPDTGVSQWSVENRRILGVEDDAPASFSTFIKCVHPKDREKVLESDRKVCSISGPVEVEYRIVRSDGEVRYVRTILQALKNEQGIPARIVGASQDITEQVQASQLLRESEERLKGAERLAHVAHWHWDLKNNQISWSEEMFRIFGQARDYIPSYEAFFQTVVPQDRERATRELNDALANKRGFSSEAQILRPDGEQRTISFIAEVLLDEEGSLAGMFGATQDITDLKKNEAALLQSQESLRALAARLVDLQESGMRELARELHDDLCQNLAALGVEISTLVPPSGKPSRSFSERIRELRVRIMNLAHDVHAMSRRLHPAILDELGLEAALRQECIGFSERTGVPANFESGGAQELLAKDLRLCFYRVAQESLNNIAKHARASNVRMTFSVDADGCTLRIEDDGRGFDPSHAKARNALGLISMQERVRLVNGKFMIQSEPGKGTTVQISVGSTE